MLQTFLKFDTVKEILKMRCQIYIFMKKVIILRKILLEPEQKKTCGNESHKKGIKHIHASAVDLLHIRRANPDWCRCRHC